MVPGVKLVVLGKQGAGKGTQCVRLSHHYVVPHVSTGDMLRAAVKLRTPLGVRAKEVMDRGELVPSDIVMEMVYFMMAADLNCCRSTQAPALSWPRVRQGFSAIDRLYGSTNRQRNVLAYLALRAGDAQAAQEAFAQIGDDWDEHVWRTKALFDASRTGQVVGKTQPLRAAND